MSVSFVEPRVYFQGFTEVNIHEVRRYLEDAGHLEFMRQWDEAMQEGISPAEALCSMYAKMCYNALTVGKNANVTRTRSIKDNLAGCFDHGHGSVFEHVQFNFTFRNVSRVFTHELVRHRVGTAFSQTSGRYCRPVRNEAGSLDIDFVHDPILDGSAKRIKEMLNYIVTQYDLLVAETGIDDPDSKVPFDIKKKMTSALRRVLPNGQSNEIAFSCNIRSLRHLVMLRTSRHAEWEIRKVFSDVYSTVKEKHPMVFFGAKENLVDGMLEVTGMNMQPYDEGIQSFNDEALIAEMERRGLTPQKLA